MTSLARLVPLVLLVGVVGLTGTGPFTLPAEATTPGIKGRIAFTHDGHLFVMNKDGSNVDDISPTCEAFEPEWTTDGRIAFIHRCGPSGTFDISIVDADGSNLQTLVATSTDDAQPAFSPSGSKLAYRSGGAGGGDIYVADADGTDPVHVTDDAAFDDSPTWSPDGSRIAFTSGRTGGGDVYVMDADGSNETRLTNSDTADITPSWSPDGRRIAYAREFAIYWSTVSGEVERPVTTDGVNAMPEWSPDSTSLALVHEGQISTVGADGLSLTTFVVGEWPAWEPKPGNGSPSIWFATTQEAHVDDALVLAGFLTIPGASSANETVKLYGRKSGEIWQEVASIPTGAQGGFSAQTSPHSAGEWTYKAVWNENGTTPTTFQATTQVTKRTAKVTVSLSQQRVEFGRAVTVTADLRSGPSRGEVGIYAQRDGHGTVLVDKGRVNTLGRLSVRHMPRSHTNYFARFKTTSSWTSATSDQKRVTVSAAWAEKQVGGYGRAGKYRLYHYSNSCIDNPPRGCPSEVFSLKPDHAGERVELHFQAYYGGHWHDQVYRWPLNNSSKIGVYTTYSDRNIIGGRHRVMARFLGDGDHAAASSKWLYWKVTR